MKKNKGITFWFVILKLVSCCCLMPNQQYFRCIVSFQWDDDDSVYTLIWIFIVLTHWNNTQTHYSVNSLKQQSDTL
jgi:hypothetical protein